MQDMLQFLCQRSFQQNDYKSLLPVIRLNKSKTKKQILKEIILIPKNRRKPLCA
jgi:hypothetical protein